MKTKSKLKSKIKKGDTVVVLSGKDKGKTGQVLTVYPCASKVLISGVNIKKKSVKANPFLGTQGGFLELEAPLFLSKVMYFDAASNSASKLGFKTDESGKSRFSKKTGELIKDL